MQVAPFHSLRPGEMYYHNNNECAAGNMIQLHEIAPGTGDDLQLCPACAQLNRAQAANED